jgi:predicted GNAT family acetyltransferase
MKRIDAADCVDYMWGDTDEYRLTLVVVPSGLAAQDPWRDDHDDRSVAVPHGDGSAWLTVRTRDDRLVAQAVFGAEGSVVRCDTITVMDAFRRQGIATRLYKLASAIFEAPVVPSALLIEDGPAFWQGRSQITA